jgi:hypothetical protein
MSGFLGLIRTFVGMLRTHSTWFSVAGISLAVVLMTASPAFGGSAVDQYSEGIPTARGQQASQDAVAPGGDRSTNIPPGTQAELKRSKIGAAAENAARITAPSSQGSSSTSDRETGSDSGLGLLLPLILAATLVGAVAIYLARRHPGPTPG